MAMLGIPPHLNRKQRRALLREQELLPRRAEVEEDQLSVPPEPQSSPNHSRKLGQLLRDVFIGIGEPISASEKHHESNLLWGPLGIGASIVITVIAATRHDLRGLLFVAWPCFVFGIWKLSQKLRYKNLSRWIALLSAVLVAISLVILSNWLAPAKTQQQDQKDSDNPQVTQVSGDDIFRKDFCSGMYGTLPAVVRLQTGEPVSILGCLKFEEVGKTSVAGFVLPSVPEAVSIQIAASIAGQVDALIKTLLSPGPVIATPGRTLSFNEFRFTRKVVLYHFPDFNVHAAAALDSTYKRYNLALEIRGTDYMSQAALRASKP